MILFKTLTELQASIVWKRLAYIAWDNVLWFIKWHLYKMQVKLCKNFICLLQAICPPQTPVQFNCSVMSYSLWSHGLQHARPPCPSLTPGVYPNSCPLSQWCHPTISSSVVPFPSCLQSFPALGLSNESVLCIRWPKYWRFSFNISPSNEYSELISFRMDWLDPCRPRDSQESSPTPQFKSISSSVVSFLYSPNLTSIHDYWKSHRFD